MVVISLVKGSAFSTFAACFPSLHSGDFLLGSVIPGKEHWRNIDRMSKFGCPTFQSNHMQNGKAMFFQCCFPGIGDPRTKSPLCYWLLEYSHPSLRFPVGFEHERSGSFPPAFPLAVTFQIKVTFVGWSRRSRPTQPPSLHYLSGGCSCIQSLFV